MPESEGHIEKAAPEEGRATPSETAEMNVEPADAPEPPSPPQIQAHQDADITVTRTGASTILTGHREEPPSTEKNKAKLDLQDYAAFSISELHSGYLSRLHANRDMEAGLVNLMKDKYEVML